MTESILEASKKSRTSGVLGIFKKKSTIAVIAILIIGAGAFYYFTNKNGAILANTPFYICAYNALNHAIPGWLMLQGIIDTVSQFFAWFEMRNMLSTERHRCPGFRITSDPGHTVMQ